MSTLALTTPVSCQRDPALQTTSITFSSALGTPDLEALRQRLLELVQTNEAPGSPLRVHIDLLPTWGGTALTSTTSGSPELYLFFDMHRLFLFRPSPKPTPRGIDSWVRLLRDGYPIQPLSRLEKSVEDQGYRFLYPLTALEILPLVWAELAPGEVALLDLVNGAVTRAHVPQHPEVAARVWTQEPDIQEFFQNRTVGESLRESFPQGLDRLLSPAGIVQQRFTVRDRLSMPFTTTEVRWHQGRRRESCFGKSRRRDRAETVAMCEALERFQVAIKPSNAELVYGSYRELRDRALDPQHLFFGRSSLCVQDELPVFDPQARLYWTPATPAGGGEPLLVPAQEVWFQTALLEGETHFIRSTTNGCALGGSIEEAALFALLEAVERDAFLTAWYLRRNARPIDPDSVEDPAFHEFRHRWQLAYPSYRFRLFDITTDMGLPTVMAVAIRRPAGPGKELLGPKVFFANACRPTAEAACRTALEDLAGFDPDMSSERRSQFRDLLENPNKVSGPADHFGLYALDETYDRLDFLPLDDSRSPSLSVAEIQDNALIQSSESYNLKHLLQRIDEQSRSLGVGVYFKDITHSFSSELGLHCVKAVTPGLFPVWFGHGSQRFHKTRRLEQLAQTWFADGPHSTEDRLQNINLEMHPFS